MQSLIWISQQGIVEKKKKKLKKDSKLSVRMQSAGVLISCRATECTDLAGLCNSTAVPTRSATCRAPCSLHNSIQVFVFMKLCPPLSQVSQSPSTSPPPHRHPPTASFSFRTLQTKATAGFRVRSSPRISRTRHPAIFAFFFSPTIIILPGRQLGPPAAVNI